MQSRGFSKYSHQLHIVPSGLPVPATRQGCVLAAGVELLPAAGTSEVRGCLKAKCAFCAKTQLRLSETRQSFWLLFL